MQFYINKNFTTYVIEFKFLSKVELQRLISFLSEQKESLYNYHALYLLKKHFG